MKYNISIILTSRPHICIITVYLYSKNIYLGNVMIKDKNCGFNGIEYNVKYPSHHTSDIMKMVEIHFPHLLINENPTK